MDQIQNIQPKKSPLWYHILTWTFVAATFVVFLIILFPWVRYLYEAKIMKKPIDTVSTANISEQTATPGDNDSSSKPITNKPAGWTLSISTSKVEIVAPVIDGVTREDLWRGVGHHPGTAWPNEKDGNIIIAGHSSNLNPQAKYGFVFKNLNKVAIGDKIQLIKKDGTIFNYQVAGYHIVNPNDTTYFRYTSVPTLMLYTCSPVYTDWQRLVVVSNFISKSKQ